MTGWSGAGFAAHEQVREAVVEALARGGGEAVQPALLQPAADLLAHYGEEIRARACVLTDAYGSELFLVPDYTVPVCRMHLESGGGNGRYVYSGPVFRPPAPGRGESPVEEHQAGIEIFGGDDPLAAEVETLKLTLDALAAAGLPHREVVLGDAMLGEAILETVPMPDHRRQRLRRRVGHPERFRALLARFTGEETRPAPPEREELLDRFGECPESEGAERVSALLDEEGIPQVGRRQPLEIAERLRALAVERHDPSLPAEDARLLDELLSISAPYKEAVQQLSEGRCGENRKLRAAIRTIEARQAALLDLAVDSNALRLDVRLGSELGYYDGFVFTVRWGNGSNAISVAGGGRYDALPRALGADIPAVGAAIWTERLLYCRTASENAA